MNLDCFELSWKKEIGFYSLSLHLNICTQIFQIKKQQTNKLFYELEMRFI